MSAHFVCLLVIIMLNFDVKRIGDYKNYIFDVDGTLYFDKPVIYKMLVKLFLYYLIRPWKLKEFFAIIKFRKNEEKGKMRNPTPLIRDWLMLKPSKLMQKHKDNVLITFLKEQKKNGKMVVTFSNFPSIEKIDALGLTEDIDYQFFPDGKKITALKPNKQGMEYILDKTKMQISETLFIGDRHETDGGVSEAIGMDYVILHKNKRLRKKQFEALKTKV